VNSTNYKCTHKRVRFSPFSCHFIPPWSKQSLSTHFSDSQSTFFLWSVRSVFAPTQTVLMQHRHIQNRHCNCHCSYATLVAAVIVESWIRAQDSPCRICSTQSGTDAQGQVFSESFGFFPRQYHSTARMAWGLDKEAHHRPQLQRHTVLSHRNNNNKSKILKDIMSLRNL
jgi:hypothetical protein